MTEKLASKRADILSDVTQQIFSFANILIHAKNIEALIEKTGLGLAQLRLVLGRKYRLMTPK